MRTVLYVVVKIVVEHPDSVTVEDITDAIGGCCDYNVSFDSPSGKIVNTELVDCRSQESW